MNLIFQHFWIVFILMHWVNMESWWSRAKQKFQANPELEKGYRSLYRGCLFWENLPWVLMGAGILSGQVRTMFEYLNPGAGNSFVLAWWGAMACLLILGSWWMCLGGGAEKLEKHPGIFMVPQWPAWKLKWYWAFVVAWNLIFACFLFLHGGVPGSEASVSPPAPPDWLFAFFPVIFVGGWLGISFLLSAMGGWSLLATKYRARGEFNGHCMHFRSGQFGFVNYGSCLILGASTAGLYLSVFFPFRISHPPLLIPWEEISATSEQRWLRQVVELTCMQCPNVVIRISRSIAEELARSSQGSFKLPTS